MFQGPTETAVVTRVIDGDTIEVSLGGRTERVRYIGMNTPEADEPCGGEATEANSVFVAGRTVTLESDVSDRDRYGRLLRYVYVDGLMVNERLVEDGWAQVATYPPDVRYVDRFLGAERWAREQGAGLWGDALCASQLPGSALTSTASTPGWTFPGTCTGPDLDCIDFSLPHGADLAHALPPAGRGAGGNARAERPERVV
jgi:micrococcal nuclease